MIVRIPLHRRWPYGVRVASNVFLLSGIVILLIVLWSEVSSTRYQATQARRFEAALRESAPAMPGPDLAPPVSHDILPQLWRSPGKGVTDPLLIGKLEIPRLGLTVMIREGVESDTLRRAVGHMPGTAAPGQVGNFVVAGHRDSFFRSLCG